MQASDGFTSDDRPFPGDDLAARVAGKADRDWFFQSGRQSVRDIQAVLAVAGRRLEDHERILDFGCGCGRIALWLSDVARKSRLYGVDIDRAAIEWAAAHLPYASFQVNEPLPPLDFPDGFFDLVYCHSVFTHIDEHYQDQWLGELRRVTKVGGLLVLSVHGEHALCYLEDQWRKRGRDPSPLRDARDIDGFVYIKDDEWTGGPFPDFYHTAFHSPGYVFAHWAEFFRIRAYVPRGSLDYQDFVLLERSTDVAPRVRARRDRLPVFTGTAVERAATAAASGPRLDYPTRFGSASRLARRIVLRILRHAMGYQREVNQATVEALRDLAANQRALHETARALGARLDRLDRR